MNRRNKSASVYATGNHTLRLGSTIFVCVLVLGLCAGAANATINYTISFANPEQHLFHVTMTIPDVHGNVTVQMPAWNATYQIRDFASHIRDLQATNEKGEMPHIVKQDKQTWSITGDDTITITYAVFWDEASPFSSQLNSNHAFMNLAEILLYVPTRRAESVYLTFGQDLPYKWNVEASSLTGEEAMGGVRLFMFSAAHYDSLVDAPIEASEFRTFALEGITPRVYVAVHGQGWNKSELSNALSKIVRYETQLMGGAPYERYTFIFHIGPNSGGGGGMEHANSTAINATNDAEAISIAAHEFFHLWNVKRIRPQSLEPIDYTREMWTRSLWFAEGATSTYASYCEVRTGMWTHEQFYEDLAQQITQLQSRPAHLIQSAEESSLDAWLEKYPQYNRPEFSISYYNKGQLLGFLLDVLIRDATDNHKSLDDVLRSMNENFANKNHFYNDSADIEATVESIAGVSFHDFFTDYVAGTVELPFSNILAKAGLGLKSANYSAANIGFEVAANFEGTQISIVAVKSGSAADHAGIFAGDTFLSINGKPTFWADQYHAGETVKVRWSHDGVEKVASLVVGSQSAQFFHVEELKDASDKQRRIREGLLKGTTN